MIIGDMETTDPPIPPHPAEEHGASTDRPSPLWWLAPALWGGRALVLITAVVVFASWATRPTWIAEGVDANGIAKGTLPNLALGLAVVTGLLGQWLCGLTTTPEAVWRDGDTLVASTVVGRRRLNIRGALVVPFRMPTRSGTAHAAFIVDRRLRPLVLLGPIAGGGRSRIGSLLGRQARTGLRSAFQEYLIGIAWLALNVAAVFVALGLIGSLIGAFAA